MSWRCTYSDGTVYSEGAAGAVCAPSLAGGAVLVSAESVFDVDVSGSFWAYWPLLLLLAMAALSEKKKGQP